MKTILLASMLYSLAITTTLMGQAAKPISKRTANDITMETLNHVRSIFASSATATNLEKANAASVSIDTTTAKIVKLQAALKAAPMPSTAEKKAFAQKMLQYEAQVSIIMKKMTNTFQTNSEEVNKILQPSISNFQAKTISTMNLINTYYPRKEMTSYMNQLKGK